MTGAEQCDTFEKCTAVLTGTLDHNEDGSAQERTATIKVGFQSLKQRALLYNIRTVFRRK